MFVHVIYVGDRELSMLISTDVVCAVKNYAGTRSCLY
jgi:hypothetical protein